MDEEKLLRLSSSATETRVFVSFTYGFGYSFALCIPSSLVFSNHASSCLRYVVIIIFNIVLIKERAFAEASQKEAKEEA